MRSVSMTEPAMSPPAIIDLEDLGLDRGAHLLIDRALRALPIGGRLEIRGRDEALAIHLRAWARAQGHLFEEHVSDDLSLPPEELRSSPRSSDSEATSSPSGGFVTRGEADRVRWHGAERAGGPSPAEVIARPGANWGLAARGA